MPVPRQGVRTMISQSPKVPWAYGRTSSVVSVSPVQSSALSGRPYAYPTVSPPTVPSTQAHPGCPECRSSRCANRSTAKNGSPAASRAYSSAYTASSSERMWFACACVYRLMASTFPEVIRCPSYLAAHAGRCGGASQ
ncbi:hypothetical protein SAMN05216259_105113 [Actinacidiphila guanduensis]|uniref:Uncharacterized protein n=1 Tax=Actinacidiphila guanduensis TaxID=310781 RepID=A0A1H0D8A1_9ACTN|nr:hypothetical protein SAMN05216259_105113 [Actinacidiphila guanduensis]